MVSEMACTVKLEKMPFAMCYRLVFESQLDGIFTASI